jgi:hypothetical protein
MKVDHTDTLNMHSKRAFEGPDRSDARLLTGLSNFLVTSV